MEMKHEQLPSAVETLRKLFADYHDKRICVVGASCVGKSTLLRYLPEAVDMDDLLFGNRKTGLVPLLTPTEVDYVCGPWTPEVGQFMTRKARELITITAGRPVFGTIVFPSDLIIEVIVPENILRERIRQRQSDEEGVFRMKRQIENEIEKSGIETVRVENV